MNPAHTIVLLLLASLLPAAHAQSLEPFNASYQAWYEGRHAGEANMQLARVAGADGKPLWQISLNVRGNRGMAGLARLNLEQSTTFDAWYDQYRPISQHTVQKALFINRRTDGIYDWHTRTAQWSGHISERRRAPIALQDGDMSTLLVNLAVIRDTEPGRLLHYRHVDGGRARELVYQVSEEPEIVEVDDISYSALRASRITDDGDDMIVWVADGVPTPIRILQREDGKDSIDLRLIEYQGVQ